MAATRAVLVGAFQSQRAEHTVDLLAPASGERASCPQSQRVRGPVSSWVSALRRCSRAAPAQLQDALPGGELQRFQIQVGHRLTTDERLNFLNDVGGQRIGEEVFF